MSTLMKVFSSLNPPRPLLSLECWGKSLIYIFLQPFERPFGILTSPEIFVVAHPTHVLI